MGITVLDGKCEGLLMDPKAQLLFEFPMERLFE
jgi:hypothetical protein